MIGVLVLMVIVGICSIAIPIIDHGSVSVKILSVLGVGFVLFGASFIGLAKGKEAAYKEALKGNNPYKMEIRYELYDSIYIPKDTVFIKIEK